MELSSWSEEERQESQGFESILYGVAHELNNPNAFIRLHAANLRKMLQLLKPALELVEKNHPEQKIGPYGITEACAKMNQMTDAILDASVRLMTIADKLKKCIGDPMSETVPVSLHEVLSNVIQIHEFLTKDRIVVEYHNETGGPAMIAGHQMEIEQALSILMTNACDAFDGRDPKKESFQITLILTDAGHEWKICMQDNAGGIPANILKKIFNPYFTTKPQGVGDGMGLPMCRAILERYHGTIDVKSEVGRGTCFFLHLPKGNL